MEEVKYVYVTCNGKETRERVPDNCDCPVPRNRIHLAACPHWIAVLADIQRVQDNHDSGFYDNSINEWHA